MPFRLPRLTRFARLLLVWFVPPAAAALFLALSMDAEPLWVVAAGWIAGLAALAWLVGVPLWADNPAFREWLNAD